MNLFEVAEKVLPSPNFQNLCLSFGLLDHHGLDQYHPVNLSGPSEVVEMDWVSSSCQNLRLFLGLLDLYHQVNLLEVAQMGQMRPKVLPPHPSHDLRDPCLYFLHLSPYFLLDSTSYYLEDAQMNHFDIDL